MKKVSILLIVMLVLFSILPSPMFAATQTDNASEAVSESADKVVENGVKKEASSEQETDSAPNEADDHASSDVQEKAAPDGNAESDTEGTSDNTNKESDQEGDLKDKTSAEADEVEQDSSTEPNKSKEPSEGSDSVEEDTSAGDEKNSSDQVKAEEDKDDTLEEAEEEPSQPTTFQMMSVNSIEKEPTSRLGHLRSHAVIYESLGDSDSTKDASSYFNAVYYIKQQANFEGDLYYKISKEPSHTKGVVGWVKSTDMSTHSHLSFDKKHKTFYIKGTGNAYTKAWGGSKDKVYNLSIFKNQEFKVHLTEKVGNNLWYRGRLNGKTVWVHNSYTKEDASVRTSKTSRLGHFRSKANVIYKEIGNESSVISAQSYKDAVYYIKQQAMVDDALYYKISFEPSSTKGVIGWVKSTDMSTHSHLSFDKKHKTFYIKGTGNAYTKAWGGSKNKVYNLSTFKNQEFKVHLTEKVGNNLWYRGKLNGKTVWVHNGYVKHETPVETSTTSKLGHLLNQADVIYKEIGNDSTAKSAESYKDAVYYIKQQATANGSLYYKISTEPSSVKGVVGWVKSTNMSTHSHVGLDKYQKKFYFTGEGKTYGKAWGGSKDLIFNLNYYRNEPFFVHLTEKVGNNIWYRGTLDGKTVWAHNSYVMPIKPESTSKLGHIRSGSVKIYTSLNNLKTYRLAGDKYINSVYYIKSKAFVGDRKFYLISKDPSDKTGVVGWVNANDLATHTHKGTDLEKNDVFFTGEGKIFTKAWGGSNDVVYSDMLKHKNQRLKVDLIEKVGNNVWYRGVYKGRTVWVHQSFVSTSATTNKNMVGHLMSKAKIYKVLGNASTLIDANPYLNAVYNIKRQTIINDTTYYLISTPAQGEIGWVLAENMSTHSYKVVDSEHKDFFFTGKGKAYSKPWGGSKDLVIKDLSKSEGNLFKVDLTSKVGKYTWYHGTYKGKKIWINESYVRGDITTYTNYNISLEEALNMQMNAGPQTDKYRNKPAYIHASLLEFTASSSINSNGVRLRTSTSTGSKDNIAAEVNKGTPVVVQGTVKGDRYQGSTKWYKIQYNNRMLYVHALLVNTDSEGITSNTANIRAKASTSSHIYDTVKKGTPLTVIEAGKTWHKIKFGTWRNPTTSDTKYHLNPDNFVNDPLKKYQFLDLQYFTGVSASQLKPLLKGNGNLDGTENTFRNAAKSVGINELYLISHANLETGRGTSPLSKGINYNGKIVYNFFGIGAYDGCAQECGAKRAYQEGWFTVEKAIMGGAKFAGDNYINVGQNTLYAMRWNPKFMQTNKKAGHQYATDIGWAGKQIGYYNDFYSLGKYNLRFNIPVYK